MAEAPQHNPPRKCVGCGAELSADSPAQLCPKCLLKLAMETHPEAGPAGTIKLSGLPTNPPDLPAPGQQLGHYAIIRPLGAGGMGAVFEAEDLESGRRIALKVLSHKLDSPEARQRFLREGRLAAAINHPNSVYIFGTEEIAGTPVIAMELVNGGTLQDRVRARGPLPIGEAVDSVLQLVEGLQAAQQVGILHRDVKPSNCYVGEDGIVKIGDFGLSISTGVRTEPALTSAGSFLGTPAFCSPEQLRGEELNLRSDMYSVGATLFYLLTGRTPFDASNLVQLLATVLEKRPPSPRQVRPEIPKGLAKAVLRCLDKQPDERFKSYADLAQALAPYSSTAPSPATLGLRFVAGVVDTTVVFGMASMINVLAFGSALAAINQAARFSPKMLICSLVWIGLATLYFALFEGLWGAAAGKLLCRLRVVGPSRNPPGFARAALRALVYVLLPVAPISIAYLLNPRAYFEALVWTQMLLGSSNYLIMALLFVTARRRNGFAAVQDLLSGSRVVSRAAVAARPVQVSGETPPPNVESALAIGPYQVLQPLDALADTKWYLGYDLKLLRKVWLRASPPNTPPVPVPLRNLGRVGRLRWLTGKRSPEENWDAFEALSGQRFGDLALNPQPWRQVRYWLLDLATEIRAAQKDGTLPELALDHVWITAESRAKLLDFPPPGAESTQSSTPPKARVQSTNSFLNALAGAALTGRPAAQAAAGDAPVPLPLHARAFLKKLPQLPEAEAVIAALKPLLGRAGEVTRLRRAALVAGCAAFPLFVCAGAIFGMSFLQELNRKSPGLMDLNTLLQMRSSARFWGGTNAHLPADREISIYIAHHYRSLITNETAWSSMMAVNLIKGDARKFAEQSVAEYPAPTQAQIADADAAVAKVMPKDRPFEFKATPSMFALILAACLLIYVGIPALLAAVLFRGGVVLLVAGVAFTRKDGARASRLRLLWRAFLTWCATLPLLVVAVFATAKHWSWLPWLALALFGLLAGLSVALPRRGLQDRLAGTWPVPR